MSQTDSFIEEVTEEVRRDRVFALIRKYGWIAILAVMLIVGGAAWREYQKAQIRAEAEGLGASLLAALEQDDAGARVAALENIAPARPGGEAVVAMLKAAEQGRSGDAANGAATLNALAVNPDVPAIYRQIASFKALLLAADTMEPGELRSQLEGIIQSGSPMRLLAEEQIALVDAKLGDTQAAIDRLNRILQDADVTAGLRRRATQLIVAMNGEPAATIAAPGSVASDQ